MFLFHGGTETLELAAQCEAEMPNLCPILNWEPGDSTRINSLIPTSL